MFLTTIINTLELMYILYNCYYNKTIVDYCNSVVADFSCSSSYKSIAQYQTSAQSQIETEEVFYRAYICRNLMIRVLI